MDEAALLPARIMATPLPQYVAACDVPVDYALLVRNRQDIGDLNANIDYLSEADSSLFLA